MVQDHPITTKGSDLSSLDPHVWAYDSFEIARDFLYTNVKEDYALSDDYVTLARSKAEKQIVRGGWRLAHLMMDIYGTEKDKFLW